MSIIYVIFPLALVIAAVALGAFIWSVRKGQFDDLDTPALRMLEDDDDMVAGSRSRPGSGAESDAATRSGDGGEESPYHL